MSDEEGQSHGHREAEDCSQARLVVSLLGGFRNHGPNQHDQQGAGGESVKRLDSGVLIS
jgi:hypothetical protein